MWALDAWRDSLLLSEGKAPGRAWAQTQDKNLQAT